MHKNPEISRGAIISYVPHRLCYVQPMRCVCVVLKFFTQFFFYLSFNLNQHYTLQWTFRTDYIETHTYSVYYVYRKPISNFYYSILNIKETLLQAWRNTQNFL